jgi:hypothetical protein
MADQCRQPGIPWVCPLVYLTCDWRAPWRAVLDKFYRFLMFPGALSMVGF